MTDITAALGRLRVPLFILVALAPLTLGTAVAAADGWRRPLRGPMRVLRGFDPPAVPWAAGHRGVDLAARAGQAVYAAGAGRVGYVGRIAGRGIVTVLHGALRTTYLPVRGTVRRAQRVSAGQRIGTVEAGLRHCPTRVCLHWGLLRGTRYLDPLSLLPGPVRLLPMHRDPTHGPVSAGRPGRTPVTPAPVGSGTPPGPPSARVPGGPSSAGSVPAGSVLADSALAGSALAGSGGAGLALVLFALAWRVVRLRPVRRALRRIGGHWIFMVARHPFGLYRVLGPPRWTLRHLAARRWRRSARPEPDVPTPANVIDLVAERRARRPDELTW